MGQIPGGDNFSMKPSKFVARQSFTSNAALIIFVRITALLS